MSWRSVLLYVKFVPRNERAESESPSRPLKNRLRAPRRAEVAPSGPRMEATCLGGSCEAWLIRLREGEGHAIDVSPSLGRYLLGWRRAGAAASRVSGEI